MIRGLSLLAVSEVRSTLRRQVMAIAVLAVAAVLALVGLVFGLNALHVWLTPGWGAMQASLIIAGGLFAVSGLAVIAALIVRSRPARPSALATGAALAAPLAAQTLVRRISPGVPAILAVVVGGALLGRHLARD